MKRAKRNRIKRTRRAMLLSSIMIFVAVAVYTSLLKQVSVDYLGDIITFKTMARTVSEAFKEKNIIISEDLVVSKDLGAALKKENKISIDAPKILAMIDEENKLETAVDAISETVEEPNGEQQNSSGAQSAPSDPQITQEEPKVEEPKKEEPKKEEPKKEEPKKEETKKTETKTTTKSTTTTSGKVRTFWPDDVVEVEPGVIQTPDGRLLEYTDVVQYEATAYCPCYNCCGKYPSNKYYGITKTGTKAKVGTIAVDPRKIPLGTKLYIEGLNGAKNYGDGVAEDIGGAIKGNIVDLYFETHAETTKWGRQQVKIYILK